MLYAAIFVAAWMTGLRSKPSATERASIQLQRCYLQTNCVAGCCRRSSPECHKAHEWKRTTCRSTYPTSQNELPQSGSGASSSDARRGG